MKELLLDFIRDPQVIRVNLFGIGGLTAAELAELKLWVGIAVAVSVVIYNITKAALLILEYRRKAQGLNVDRTP